MMSEINMLECKCAVAFLRLLLVTLIDVSAVIEEQIFSFSGPLPSPVFVFVRRPCYGRKVEGIKKKRPFLPLPAKVANNWVGGFKIQRFNPLY